MQLTLEKTTGLLVPAGTSPALPRGATVVDITFLTGGVAGLLSGVAAIALKLFTPADLVTPVATFSTWVEDIGGTKYSGTVDCSALALPTYVARLDYGSPTVESHVFHVRIGEGTASGATAPEIVPADQRASVYVSAAYGSDSSGRREDLRRPFATLLAAQTAAIPGDTIYVLDGIFAEWGLGKDLVNWWFTEGTGANLTLDSAGADAAKAIFTDYIKGTNTLETRRFSVLGAGTFQWYVPGNAASVDVACFALGSTLSELVLRAKSVRVKTDHNSQRAQGIRFSNAGALDVECESIVAENIAGGTAQTNTRGVYVQGGSKAPRIRCSGDIVGIGAGVYLTMGTAPTDPIEIAARNIIGTGTSVTHRGLYLAPLAGAIVRVDVPGTIQGQRACDIATNGQYEFRVGRFWTTSTNTNGALFIGSSWTAGDSIRFFGSTAFIPGTTATAAFQTSVAVTAFFYGATVHKVAVGGTVTVSGITPVIDATLA